MYFSILTLSYSFFVSTQSQQISQMLPAGQEPQVKLPGRFIHGTGGSVEQAGLLPSHSFTSTTQAGSEPDDVHPSSQIHVYLG